MENEGEKFSDDPHENFQIENEILKIKLKAQYGDSFFMSENTQMPPEIENEFLNKMINFEENFKNLEFVTLHEKIGTPAFKKIEDLPKEDINEELIRLILAMEEHGILFDVNDGPYPDEIIYKFITEELFEQEVEKESLLSGGFLHFSYEEFYPNNKIEIEKNTHEFLQHWFTKGFDEYSSELANDFITADGKQLDKEAFFKKVNMFFNSFVVFKNDGYNIDEIKFDLNENYEGMGHAEGVLKYDAEMENGELIHYEGPFKLYMQREDKFWSIMYFVMPGFVW